jgi:hypothetical protein
MFFRTFSPHHLKIAERLVGHLMIFVPVRSVIAVLCYAVDGSIQGKIKKW